eukprot:794778-Pyramimonas_sp.AAC.1
MELGEDDVDDDEADEVDDDAAAGVMEDDDEDGDETDDVIAEMCDKVRDFAAEPTRSTTVVDGDAVHTDAVHYSSGRRRGQDIDIY